MTEFLQFLKGFDLQTLIPLGILIWYLNNNLKKDMDARIERIEKEFKFINIRLSRVEGTVYGKDIYKVESNEK